MCGRYAQLADLGELDELFELSPGSTPDGLSLAPRWNAAPTQALPVVVPLGSQAGDGRGLRALRWGMMSATPGRLGKPPTINARGEGLWRGRGRMAEAFRRRRCVVPASGFYEWAVVANAPSARAPRVPHFIRRRDRRGFGFAGVWAPTEGPGGGVWEGFAIVTVPAAGPVADLHPRMPAVLDPPGLAIWLDPTIDAPDLLALALGSPDDRARRLAGFEAYPVGAAVGSAAAEGPELVAPAVRDDGPLFAGR